MRYELNVIGASTVDVVQSAGGWLFDLAMAGWHVNVLLPGHDDERPLKILGLRMRNLQVAANAETDVVSSIALAVSAKIFDVDAGARTKVLSALRSGSSEVALWGNDCPADLRGNLTPVPHHLSQGAIAFKARALASAELPSDSVGPTEWLFLGGASYVTQELDLLPAL